MATKREGNYVWATWLSRLMAGDSSCEWGPWFKTHYQGYSKAPSDFDQATWQMNHTRLLRQLRLEREAAGEQILIEGQTRFYYERRGPDLVVSGKPDLLAISGKTVTVYDAKTGQPRAADQIQVMIYMYCIPLSSPRFEPKMFTGQVVYEDHRVDIPPVAVGAAFEDNFNYFLAILDSDTAPIKVPSSSECRFCDIGKADCPERIDAPADQEEGGPPPFATF
jgi:hypothetical protein